MAKRDRSGIDARAEWFTAACNRLREWPIESLALILRDDPALRLVVAAWPSACIPAAASASGGRAVTAPPPADGLPLVDLQTLAWVARPIDRYATVARLRAILGEAFPVASRIEQAIACGFILPDGTINRDAENIINPKTEQYVKDVKRGAHGTPKA